MRRCYQHAALDNEKFEYKLPEPATQFFEKLSSQSSSLIDELLWKDVALKKRLRCPHCGKKDIDVRVCDPEKLGIGWMDKAFAVDCEGCGAVINKEGLCAAKFESDVEVFLKAGAEGRMRFVPLPPPMGPGALLMGEQNDKFRQPRTRIPH